MNLAVTFPNAGEPAVPGEPILEAAQHPRSHAATCRLCGECDIGCNYGSKNTLDYTYYPAAWHAGADIRTRHEVRTFAPREGGGYTLDYVVHDEEREGTPTDTSRLPAKTITCDRLVLAAGTLGTTYLLLEEPLGVPGAQPGARHALLRQRRPADVRAQLHDERPDGTKVPHVLDAARAPVITSAIRVPDALDGRRRRPRLLPRGRRPAGVRQLDLQTADARPPRSSRSPTS